MVRRFRLRLLVVGLLVALTGITSLILYKSLHAVPTDTKEQRVYVPIVMYHEIKTYKLGKDVISPFEFESDLQYLQKNGFTTITITDLINYVYKDTPLPEKPIVLSFDDGYLTTYRYAFPLLKKYNMKMVLSVIGKNSEDFTRIHDDNLDYSHVTWSQLRELVESGLVEVQNHTYNLHQPGGKGRLGCTQRKGESLEDYQRVLLEDAFQLQNKLFNETGWLPNTYTYPYGQSSENTLLIIKKLKFKAVLTSNYGINVITKDPETLYRLKRVARAHNNPIGKLLAKANKTIRS